MNTRPVIYALLSAIDIAPSIGWHRSLGLFAITP